MDPWITFKNHHRVMNINSAIPEYIGVLCVLVSTGQPGRFPFVLQPPHGKLDDLTPPYIDAGTLCPLVYWTIKQDI